MPDLDREQARRMNAKAESCLQMIERLNISIRNHQINDYGEVTGFCDEADDIWNSLYDHLGQVTARAARTLSRINKAQMAAAGVGGEAAGEALSQRIDAAIARKTEGEL
jgi:hypothetical protein